MTEPSAPGTSSPPPLALDVRGVSKRFGALTAVDNVSFSVRQGEIFGLVGPDGAGKTTTMRMLASVMRVDTGAIRIDEVDVVANPERTKRHVSYMPQRFGLYDDLTVDENIRFFADLFDVPRKVCEERAVQLLTASRMMPFRQRLAGKLSGGMKQKLGLTCALVHAPRVLLLDEPTTGVDPVSRREFWQILYSLRATGVAMVISTAYLDEAERCDRLALFDEGSMMYCDTPQQLKRELPGAIVRVASARPREAAAAIEPVAGVRGVLLVGDGVHVHVDDAQACREPLARALQAAGVPAGPVETIEPTIEDLFVALLERKHKAT